MEGDVRPLIPDETSVDDVSPLLATSVSLGDKYDLSRDRVYLTGSQRQIPLVGASMWAARRIKANASSDYAFPRYTNHDRCNANSASNGLNKWLQFNFREDIVIHGFRHAIRDRLRAVNCPSEMIDQIGGWSSGNIGKGYGDGFTTPQLAKHLNQLNASN